MLSLFLAAVTGSACNYQLDAAWPVDLGKIPPFITPSGVDVDPVKGEVYVCQQRGFPKMTVWDRDTGKLVRSWGNGTIQTAHGCRVMMPLAGKGGDPEIWVADVGNGKPDTGHVVKAFTPNGTLIRTVGEVGTSGTGLAPLQFGNVADLTFTADQSTIVFVDGDGGPNNRVVEVDAASLKVIQSWGGNGTANGKFRIPHGVAVDECNRVWVADRMNNRTQIFTIKGEWLATWDCMDEPPYGLRVFEGGAGAAAGGRILVTGGGNGKGVGRPGFVNRLNILSYKTDCTTPADLGKCTVESGFDVDPDSTAHFSAIDGKTSDIYVTEVSANKVHKYTC